MNGSGHILHDQHEIAINFVIVLISGGFDCNFYRKIIYSLKFTALSIDKHKTTPDQESSVKVCKTVSPLV